MKRLKEFNESFANIILGLTIAFLLSYILFPDAAWMQASKEKCDYVLAGGLILFFIKWLHESSVSSHRFSSGLTSSSPRAWLHVLLFASKVGTPLISLLIVAKVVKHDTASMVGASGFMLGVGLFLLHAILYFFPDLYLWKIRPQLLGNHDAASWKPQTTIRIWLIIDLVVISVAIITIIGGGWILRYVTGQHIKFAIGLVMVSQTIADWILNWRFFFGDRPMRKPVGSLEVGISS